MFSFLCMFIVNSIETGKIVTKLTLIFAQLWRDLKTLAFFQFCLIQNLICAVIKFCIKQNTRILNNLKLICMGINK